MPNIAGTAPNAARTTGAAAGPPTPNRMVSLDTSVTVTFDRNTYIERRLRIGSAMSAGSSPRKSAPPSFQSTKLARIRPLGELKLVYWQTSGASALTSFDNWPWRKVAASGPAMARMASGGASHTTAASRAAISAARSAVRGVGEVVGLIGGSRPSRIGNRTGAG